MKKIKTDHKNGQGFELPLWLLAFLVNLIVAALAVVPFILRDEGYFAMSHDFTAQEIAFQIFMNDSIKSGSVLWNWGIDIGGNFLETFSFYNVGSIFFLITLLFPAASMPLVMGWMIIVKFAVAGATAALYLKRHVKNRTVVIMASLLYAFSGFQCSSVVFYHFQDAVALFPLMLAGLEALVEDKKRGRLLAACIVNVFCNYVFFVGNVLFLIIYYVIKYLLPELGCRKKLKEYLAPILSCMVEGLLGMMAAGVLLIPAIHGTMSNSRMSNHLAGEAWFSVTTSDILQMIKAFFMPAEVMSNVASVTRANWMTNAAYLPLFGIVFVLAYVLTKKDWLSRFMKVAFVIALFPILNNLFMFFSSEGYRRWYFMLSLLMALATAKVVEQPREYKIWQATGISAGILGFFVFMTRFVKWNENEESIIFSQRRYIFGLVIAVTGIMTVVAVVKCLYHYRRVVLCVLTAACGGFLLLVNIHGWQTVTDNTNLDFKTYPNSYAKNAVNYMTEIAGSLEADILPYRYYFDEGIGHSYYNIAMTNSLPSINSFVSTSHSSLVEYYDALGVGRGTWTNVGPEGIRELLGAKYVVSNIEQPQYTYIQDLTNSNGQVMKLYENENALPIGFTYDTYITESEFMNVPAELRPTVMLKTLVVKDEEEEKVADILRHEVIGGEETITAESRRAAIEARKKECSSTFTYGNDHFESVIVTDAVKYAFFSVPYDTAWKAVVNGKDVEILNINGLMAVELEEGENQIAFTYEYAPLKVGVLCSIVGILLAVVYAAVPGRRQKAGRDGIEVGQ